MLESETVIITIPKPGKDCKAPQNYRPISLLNTDLKMYATILANRLLELTTYLINPDQIGFVKARDGTRRMFNLIIQKMVKFLLIF